MPFVIHELKLEEVQRRVFVVVWPDRLTDVMLLAIRREDTSGAPDPITREETGQRVTNEELRTALLQLAARLDCGFGAIEEG